MIRRLCASASAYAGRFAVIVLTIVAGVVSAVPVFAQAAPGRRSSDGIWQTTTDGTRPVAQRRTDLLGSYTVTQLDRAALAARLAGAPHEAAVNRGDVPVELTLPLPDGRFSRFRIEESPILAPELSAAFPDFKTYRGVGLDDPTATARLDLTPAGFHAQIIAAGGTVYVDPYAPGDLVTHVSYDKATLRRGGSRPPDEVITTAGALERAYNAFPITNGTSLRIYRLALAANGEYTAAAGGTKPQALARMTTTMNRVNGIYERELAVRMTVATGTPGDPTALIYTSAGTDPYSNNSAAINENQTNLDTVIGSGNYDIGHVFTTGSGGVAQLQAVCNAGGKARGTTGLSNPVGDAFDVDYVAHEMGHQFGGNHTFNSSVGNCSGNRSASHAFEVGSGSTIQAYSGICGSENLQIHSDDIFTFESLNEMTAFITNPATGGSCGTVSATGNTLPVVSVSGPSFTVPANTPFELTASATDANGDALTYLWEEHDLGTASTGANAWIDDGSRPLFRSYAPTTSPTRSFPSLTYVLNNANVPPTMAGGFLVGEALPTTNRTMQFHVTVRDNRAGGGGISTAQTSVTVTTALGPFQVTSPNSTMTVPGGSAQTITWAVNGTNALATNVAILFSNNGGLTFPTVLAASTPNDGSETVIIPIGVTSTARIKVFAVGNIFFDVSDTNFSVTSSPPVPPGAFTKVTPANGDSNQPRSPVLSWSTSLGANSYEYCLDTSSNATCNASWVNVGNVTSVTVAGLSPVVTYSWHVRAVNLFGTADANSGSWWSFTTRPTGRATPGDFDGDGRADTTVFRSSTGTWYHLYAAGGWSSVGWGGPGDRTVPGDYDGDGRIDITVFRPSSGVWYILRSSTATLQTLQWGASTDEPVPADYDGDGRTDIAVYRPGTGVWYILQSTAGVRIAQWGNGTEDRPVPADYDGDGRADIAVYRPSNGTWYLARSTAGGVALNWGNSTDTPVPADYDGDGRTDIAVYRPSTGTWHLARSTAGGAALVWGNSADTPVPGDYDGDGRADIAVFRPSDGSWYVLPSGGSPTTRVSWGNGADTPILAR